MAAGLQWKAHSPDAGGARTWNGKPELKLMGVVTADSPKTD